MLVIDMVVHYLYKIARMHRISNGTIAGASVVYIRARRPSLLQSFR